MLPTLPQKRGGYWKTTVKRKRNKEEIERLRRQAQDRPNVRRLRELAERAQAELDARKGSRSQEL